MLKLNDFILLKALYNEQIHNAVLAKDQATINVIVNERYTSELKGRFCSSGEH